MTAGKDTTTHNPASDRPTPARSVAGWVCVIAACLLFGGVRAEAQNALGDGRGLENRRVTLGRGNVRRTDLQQELRFRNAIVTGNAPNFLSFRGDVPYSEPDAFRGDLGSNDLFAFRRDSLFSGLAGQGIRGTEALQFQASLTTGTAPPPGLVGPFIVERSGVGRSARTLLDTPRIDNDLRRGTLLDTPPVRRADPLDSFERADGTLSTGGPLRGLLRSPATYTSTRDYRPAYLGVIPDGQRRSRALTATGLLGVRLSPVGAEEEDEVAAQRERIARAADAADAAPGTPARAGAQRVDSRVETAHDRLLRRFAQRDAEADLEGQTEDQTEGQTEGQPEGQSGAGPGTDTGGPTPGSGAIGGGASEGELEPWQRRLIELRNYINQPGSSAPGEDAGPGPPEDPRGAAPDRGEDGAGTPGQPDPRGFDRLLDEEVVIERLADAPDTIEDTYLRLVRRAEDQIRAGRYFDAEETFSIAMSVRPNDAAAQIGRIHAQLGAGLYLSAAINIRQVFTLFPELAAARFGRRLLPPRDRLAEIVASLEGYLDSEVGASRRQPRGDGGRVAGTLRSEAGLLLAYVGRQTRDRSLVRRGLADYREIAEGDPRSETDVDQARLRLLRVLEPAWLGAGAAEEPTGDGEPGPP